MAGAVNSLLFALYNESGTELTDKRRPGPQEKGLGLLFFGGSLNREGKKMTIGFKGEMRTLALSARPALHMDSVGTCAP